MECLVFKVFASTYSNTTGLHFVDFNYKLTTWFRSLKEFLPYDCFSFLMCLFVMYISECPLNRSIVQPFSCLLITYFLPHPPAIVKQVWAFAACSPYTMPTTNRKAQRRNGQQKKCVISLWARLGLLVGFLFIFHLFFYWLQMSDSITVLRYKPIRNWKTVEMKI